MQSKKDLKLKIALAILGFGAMVFVAFYAYIQLSLARIDPKYISKIPQSAVSELPPTALLYEVDLGQRIPGTEEKIDFRSFLSEPTDSIFLLRYYIEGGTIVGFDSTKTVLPTCANGDVFELHRVCADIAKFDLIQPQEILGSVTIQWEQDQEGRIWVEQGAGYYDGNQLIEFPQDSQGIVSLPETGDDQVITGDVRPEQYYWVTDEWRIVFSLGALMLMVGIVYITERLVKTKGATRIFKAILLISFFMLIYSLALFIERNYFAPVDSEAAVTRVDKNQLVQPVLRPVITMAYGNCSVCMSYCYGPPGLCHTGIDLGSAQDIYAAGPGVVKQAGQVSGWTALGILVTIEHTSNSGQKYYTRYAHLARTSVSVGQSVDANTKIGYMGQTGNAFGVHLHFELRKDMNTWSASVFEDPTAIVSRKRGEVPIEKLQCGQTGCADDGRSGKAADAVCEGWTDSANTEFECKELNNRCERIRCPNGATVISPCDCQTQTTTTPTLSPTVTPKVTLTTTPKLTQTPSITPTGNPGGIDCGPLDINSDKIINYIDLLNFSEKYNKKCSDYYDKGGCGALDYNHDYVVDYKDLYNMSVKYYPKLMDCSL
jgi:murein DD-endopeptidase MepM/ murein hydrolase activator NlpD